MAAWIVEGRIGVLAGEAQESMRTSSCILKSLQQSIFRPSQRLHRMLGPNTGSLNIRSVASALCRLRVLAQTRTSAWNGIGGVTSYRSLTKKLYSSECLQHFGDSATPPMPLQRFRGSQRIGTRVRQDNIYTSA